MLTGGQKMINVLTRIERQITDGGTLRVGFLETAIHSSTGRPVAEIAVIQEFGAPKRSIPPRPFFMPLIEREKSAWAETLGRLLPAYQYDVESVFTALGSVIVGEIKEAISDVNDPALSPITLMLRKMKSEGVEITGAAVGEAARRVAAGESYAGVSTKPLIDTGEMQAAANFEVTR